MSKVESDRSLARSSPRQHSFGKVAAVFLVLGPPISTPLFFLATALGNQDPWHEKIDASLGMVFSVYGLLTCYAIGIVPALIAALVYLKSYDDRRSVGLRFLVATLLGALVYFLAYLLVLFFLDGGQVQLFALQFSLYGAGAGAVSTFICALIVETCIKPMQIR
ncbi:hypothetical protein ACE103_03700 [Bradyrhizobium sp. ma5]|uniref:hypothetical protein n=1 Tax=Bradyrhizobium sp. ma5 TaxID=3344828 RepID=UPI0035D4C9BA